MQRVTLLLLLAGTASASEIVWIGDAPTPSEWETIALSTGAIGAPLSLEAFRGAASALSDADRDAYRKLASTLSEVRAYETRLDGELIIMRDLQRSLDDISVIRDEADRGALFTALAYQGFAVDRYFADQLGSDDLAAPYRVDSLGTSFVRPWVEAVALAPDRTATAYEIAEAPQRVAFQTQRASFSSSALRANLVLPEALPAGARLVVDGVDHQIEAAQTLSVLPGPHYVHMTVGDHVIARWNVHAERAGEHPLHLPIPEDVWSAWVEGLRAGDTAPIPAAGLDDLEALGGEVWFVVSEGGKLRSWRATRDGLTTEPIQHRGPPTPREGRLLPGWSVAVGLDGAWIYSGDFYTQSGEPSLHDRASVNAGALAVDVQATLDLGIGRVGAGVDVWTPFGSDHVALTGAGSQRLRPYVYGVAGVRWIQASAGFVFPYHPAAGLQATIPVWRGLEIRAGGTIGFPGALTRSDGTSYDAQWLTRVGAGIGYRFGG